LAIRNVICIAIDRLHAGYLGPYGNTWVETPSLNEFAAKSFLLDRAVTDSPKLEDVYRSFWLGLNSFCPVGRNAEHGPLAVALASAGFHTVLVTDEPEVANHRFANSLTERIIVPRTGLAENETVAETIDDTEAAAFFDTAIKRLAPAKSPTFLWLHTGTLGHRWDAPLEFREHYTDEDDPPVTDLAAAPNRLLPKNFDPDEVTAAAHAYAGQITMVDELLGGFLEAVDATYNPQETLIVLVSPRGIGLGEHHRLGPCDDALYSEVTHTPWMFRFPSAMQLNGRSQAIVQPADLYPTILEACELQSPSNSSVAGLGRSLLPLAQGERASAFDRAYVRGTADKAMVVPNWSLRVVNEKMESDDLTSESNAKKYRLELFVRPDDWFEVNEVSDRCPEIADSLAVELQKFEAACDSAEPAPLAKLPDELCTALA
jgi:arylsulfatase A-like enzyme